MDLTIVVTHLTRMRQNHVCVAGTTLDGARHVRPVNRNGHRWTRDDPDPGRRFGIGQLAVLRDVRSVGRPPEVEDLAVAGVELGPRLPDCEFWALIESWASDRLIDVFGADLKATGSSASTREATGSASLGYLRAQDCGIVIRGDEVRLDLVDADLGEIEPRITDLRLYAGDQTVMRATKVVGRRVSMGHDLVLSVGLTRAFARPGGEHRHWLQVNNIHFRDYFDDHPTLRPPREWVAP